MARTVLIVDDHADFRRLARRMLEADGYRVVGEAEDGRSALAAKARLRPDVVLLDVQLPDVDGFEVADGMAGGDGPAVVLTSTRDAADYARRVERSSARGFIAKSDLSGDALAALLG